MKEKTRSLIMIHSAVLLLGLTGLFGRFINLPAAFIVLGRLFFASVSLGVTLKARNHPVIIKNRRDAFLFVCAGAVLAFHWTTFYLSVKASTVAIAVITFSTFPLFLTFIEPLVFGERIKIREITLAAVMLCGIRIITPELGTGGQTAIGIAFGMASSLAYAILSLLNRKLAEGYFGSVIAFFQQAAATLIMLPVLFFTRPALTARDLALLALLGVVFTGLAHSLYISGLKNISGRTAGMIAGLESVYGIAAAALLLAEYPRVNEIAGGAVIFAAALFSSWYSARE